LGSGSAIPIAGQLLHGQGLSNGKTEEDKQAIKAACQSKEVGQCDGFFFNV
jgi:hypothetical protein